MKLFRRKKQTELTETQKKWNKIWELYESGELANIDYNTFVLCEYESGVNGEGHSGWFFNIENTEGKDEINKFLSALENTLPDHLYDNLVKAFHSYGTENEDDVCESADDYFYEHEQEVIEYLQCVANNIKESRQI